MTEEQSVSDGAEWLRTQLEALDASDRDRQTKTLSEYLAGKFAEYGEAANRSNDN